MAVTKTVTKLTDSEVVVKIAGSGASATIDLQTDLITAQQALETTQVVNITGVTWTGEATHTVTIDRNSVRVMTLNSAAAGNLTFDGQTMSPDNINNTHDLVVTMGGTGQGECWIKLRKVSGYAPKIETAAFGPYDNPNAVGA